MHYMVGLCLIWGGIGQSCFPTHPSIGMGRLLMTSTPSLLSVLCELARVRNQASLLNTFADFANYMSCHAHMQCDEFVKGIDRA